MGKKEKKIIDKILLSVDPDTQRMFRVNSGQGWAGKSSFRKTKTGDAVVIQNPRAFHGMPTGFPDMIGWETIYISRKICGNCFHCGYDENEKTICKINGLKVNIFDYTKICKEHKLLNPDHVARFVAREVKATGGLSEDQVNLRETMISMGVDYAVLTE